MNHTPECNGNTAQGWVRMRCVWEQWLERRLVPYGHSLLLMHGFPCICLHIPLATVTEQTTESRGSEKAGVLSLNGTLD